MKKIFLILLLSFGILNANAQLLRFYHSTNKSSAVAGIYDADAQAYMTAIPALTTKEKGAIDSLVKMFKANSLWTRVNAIYPFLGASADNCKWNLKNPQDLDAAFRLVFTGGVTYAADGITGNGSTGVANTFFNPINVYASGQMSIGIFSNTDITGTFSDMGALSGATQYVQIYAKFGGVYYGQVNTQNASQTGSTLNSIGWYFANRVSNSDVYIQKDNVQALTTGGTASYAATVNNNIRIMAQTNTAGNAALFSPRKYSFAFIGGNFSQAEATTIYNIITTYKALLL